MDRLLRAAIDQRDRDQGIADDEMVDAERMAWLDKAARPKCRFCGASIRDDNSSGICAMNPECRRRRQRLKSQAFQRKRSARR
jgi:hypothetical protein